jgi:hypothetical protein
MEVIDLVKRKRDDVNVPRREEDDLNLDLSPEGRQRFAEMTEKTPNPGAAKRRIDRLEAELAASRAKRLAAARAVVRKPVRGLAQPV